ncbi:S38A9 protein, partial [Phaetusa simplex]|nr:S38A9 protein [Phaetusa simplex]
RPFHVEPTNIVSVNDDMQRVTDEASAMNKRIHYYSRLTSPSDRALLFKLHVYVCLPLLDNPSVSWDLTILAKPKLLASKVSDVHLLSVWGLTELEASLLLHKHCLVHYVYISIFVSSSALIDTSNWEFPDVCKYYFGSFGQWSSLLFSMVSLIGAMVVYWVLMSNFLFNTGKFIYNFVHDINVTDIVPGTNGSNKVICPSAASGHPPQNRSVMFSSGNDTGFELFEEWWNKSKTVPFYLIAVLLPLLNLKSPSFFAKFNVLGTVSVVYLVFLVTVKAAHLGIHLEYHWFTENDFFVPDFVFPQVRDLSIAYFLVGLTYLYVGVIIFASFPSPPLSKECIEQ